MQLLHYSNEQFKFTYYSKELFDEYAFRFEPVVNSFYTWQRTGWTQGRRNSESALGRAIESINPNVDDIINKEYKELLAEYLYVLCLTTADQHGYLLNEPERIFVQFLLDETAYTKFIACPEGKRLLSWLFLNAADQFGIEGDFDHVIDAHVQRLVGRHIDNPRYPKMRDVAQTLYGAACWELYATSELDDFATILWDAGLTPAFINKKQLLGLSSLPNDLSFST